VEGHKHAIDGNEHGLATMVHLNSQAAVVLHVTHTAVRNYVSDLATTGNRGATARASLAQHV
jgi:predicted transcriptional regulator